MRRNGHWLRGNPTTQIPRRHLCIATETDQTPLKAGHHVLTSAALAEVTWENGQGKAEGPELFADSDPFWMAVQRKLTPGATTIIWLAFPRQDLPALGFTRLVEIGDFARKYWVWADPPIILAGKLWGYAVKFLGIENFVEGWKVYRNDVEEDCRALAYDVLELLRFVHREDLGHLRSTVAGQSFQAYRHLHLPGKIGIHNNNAALSLERSCPLASPIDQRRCGEVNGPVYVLDVNSLYPWVMANYPYPRKLLWYTDTIDVEQLRRATIHELVIARVSGRDMNEQYLVKRKDGALWTHFLDNDALAGVDLDRALRRGAVSHVSEACSYEGAGVFAQFGQWAWDMRQRYREAGWEPANAIAKALGTRLWSQFASRLERWEAYEDSPPPPKPYCDFFHSTVDGNNFRCRAVAGVVDRLVEQTEPDDSFPALSAFVASYARGAMLTYANIAGPQNVLYGVADAIHVNQEGFDKLASAGFVDDRRFGSLKISAVIKKANYLKPNVHVLDGILTQAGRPLRAVETSPGCWSWSGPVSLASEIFRQPDGFVHIENHWAETPRGGK